MILTNKSYSIKSKNTNIDANGIENIYRQLMEYYGIDKNKMKAQAEAKAKKEMDKKIKEKDYENSNLDRNKDNKQNGTTDNDESGIDEKMAYLFNIIDVDKKQLKHKNYKVEKNKHIMMKNVNKPIELDCNEKLFNASARNDVSIIKNY